MNDDVTTTLARHKLWLENRPGGAQADLRGADLSSARLGGLDLREAVLAGAKLDLADLHEADLRGADLSSASLMGTFLSRANLQGARLSEADLHRAILEDANLDDADLDGACLDRAVANGASMVCASLANAALVAAEFDGARLDHAVLSQADLTWLNLEGASLRETLLVGARMNNCNLADADLRGAVLPTPPLILPADWGPLDKMPDPLAARCLAYWAACLPDPTAMDRWAKGGPVPFDERTGTPLGRLPAKPQCWDPGLPVPRAYDLMVDLIRVTCRNSDFHEKALL